MSIHANNDTVSMKQLILTFMTYEYLKLIHHFLYTEYMHTWACTFIQD